MTTNNLFTQFILLNKPVGHTEQESTALLIKANGLGFDTRDIKEPVTVIVSLPDDAEGLLVFVPSNAPVSIQEKTLIKEYEVIITERLTKAAETVLENGLNLDNAFAEGITIKKTFNKGRQVIVTVSLTGNDGRIRPMFERLGINIHTLRRTKVDTWKLGTLPTGRWRFV